MTTATASISAPSAHRDFPSWLSPMLVKELRQGLRTRGFVGAVVGFQLIMLLLMLWALAAQGSPNGGLAHATLSTGFFWSVIAVQLLLVTPARALGGLQQEIDTRTLDLLMLTRLDAWRVVLGKWISLLAEAVLLLVAMLPYLAVRYFTNNADLVAELGVCAMMLGVSAMLAAVGLWASAIARPIRILLLIALVTALFAGWVAPMLGGRTTTVVAVPFARFLEFPLDVFNGLLVTAFFLVNAVRNIAPPAENHCLLARVLPVLAILPAPAIEGLGAHALALRQLYIGAGFLALVLLFELGATRLPTSAHWRAWRRSGPLLRFVGRCALPGWQSAVLFAVIAAGVWAFMALVIVPDGSVASRQQAEHLVWLALLALAGLVFPAVLQSMVRAVPAPAMLVYLVGLVIPALLAALAVWAEQSRWHVVAARRLMETMPFSSFLFETGEPTSSPLVTAAQGMVAVLVLGAAFWQSRLYWEQLRIFDARERATRLP